jgi:hypothetical protein
MNDNLATAANDFLAHKRALGRKYQTEEATLHLLLAFADQHGIEELDQLTSCLLDEFVASRPRSVVPGRRQRSRRAGRDAARAARSASRFGYPGDGNGVIVGSPGTPSPGAHGFVGAGQQARSTARGLLMCPVGLSGDSPTIHPQPGSSRCRPAD